MRQKKIQRRKSKKAAKPEFTAKTRVYDLVKAEFHDELKNLVDDIREFVKDGETIDWKHLNYFNVVHEPRKKTELIQVIAQFLLTIGKGTGMKCKMSVFVRYLASNEHSNFCLKPGPLNTLIYRMFAYLEDNEKDAENL
jgi:hypothetical protein